MFCSKCGAQLPDGTQFCSNCGAPQAPAQPESQAQPQQPMYEALQQPNPAEPAQGYYQAPAQQPYGNGGQPYQPAPAMPPQNDDGKKKKTIIIAVVAVIVVIAIVIGALFATGVIGGKDKEDEDDKTTVSDEKKDEQDEKDTTEPDTAPATSSTQPSTSADATAPAESSGVTLKLTAKDDVGNGGIFPQSIIIYGGEDTGKALFDGSQCTYVDDDSTTPETLSFTFDGEETITFTYEITANLDNSTMDLKFKSSSSAGGTVTADQFKQTYGTIPTITYTVESE